jgi:hypothetical protein
MVLGRADFFLLHMELLFLYHQLVLPECKQCLVNHTCALQNNYQNVQTKHAASSYSVSVASVSYSYMLLMGSSSPTVSHPTPEPETLVQ